MIENKYYGLRHDVWGLGVFSYFLLSGKFPFSSPKIPSLCDKIIKEEPDWGVLRRRNIDKKIINLIKGMLLKDPDERWTIREIMRSPVFKYLKKHKKKVN